MIADPVRYMSVHNRKQPDSHGRSWTSPGQKEQPARPGNPSSRAIFAGGGRCWVRTNVGLADGFTDLPPSPPTVAADLRIHHPLRDGSRRRSAQVPPASARALRPAASWPATLPRLGVAQPRTVAHRIDPPDNQAIDRPGCLRGRGPADLRPALLMIAHHPANYAGRAGTAAAARSLHDRDDTNPRQIRRKPVLNGLINEYVRRLTL
jgi:hypothetical protein